MMKIRGFSAAAGRLHFSPFFVIGHCYRCKTYYRRRSNYYYYIRKMKKKSNYYPTLVNIIFFFINSLWLFQANNR